MVAARFGTMDACGLDTGMSPMIVGLAIGHPQGLSVEESIV